MVMHLTKMNKSLEHLANSLVIRSLKVKMFLLSEKILSEIKEIIYWIKKKERK